jgi:biotin operon repressor
MVRNSEFDQESVEDTDGEGFRTEYDDEPYAEGTPLSWVFGDHPEVKLTATFLSERDTELNQKRASELAGISRARVSDYIGSLCKCGVVEPGVSAEHIQLYRLASTDATNTLGRLEAAILSHSYEPGTDPVQPADDAGTLETSDIEDPYAEDTPLTWIFGDHPEVKLIAALLSEPDQRMSVSDWGRIAGVSRGAVNNHRDRLAEHGIAVDLGTEGRKHFYRLARTEVTELIAKLEGELLEYWYQHRVDSESDSERR